MHVKPSIPKFNSVSFIANLSQPEILIFKFIKLEFVPFKHKFGINFNEHIVAIKYKNILM